MFGPKVLLVSAAAALAACGSAMAGGLKPGQYSLGGIQQICLAADGAWYGVSFPFQGHWRNAPAADDSAPIWGAYDGGKAGRFHDTINVSNAAADWYEWNEDGSYSTMLPGLEFTRVKATCDAAAAKTTSGRAATQ
ncbi:MAG: hypothetical protein M3T55_02065 [Pseudomonadota bacterium]|nr:hypothetical protein [Pseudomonadota bacterium]